MYHSSDTPVSHQISLLYPWGKWGFCQEAKCRKIPRKRWPEGRHIVLVIVPPLRYWETFGMSVDQSIAGSRMGYIEQKQYLIVLCLRGRDTKKVSIDQITLACVWMPRSALLASCVLSCGWLLRSSFVQNVVQVFRVDVIVCNCKCNITIANLYWTSEFLPSSLTTVSLLC